jgi:type IV pilus assembly protein PilW
MRTETKRLNCGNGERGLTLIELMISLLLGIIFSAGLVGLYLESKRNYAAEEEMARIQENGRYTLNLLKQELLLAGFFAGTLKAGDMTVEAVNTDCAGSDWALDASNPIEFVNDHNSSSDPVTTTGTTLTCLVGGDIQPESDVLTIKRTAGEPTLRRDSFADNFTASSAQQWYMRVVNYGDTRVWSKLASVDLTTEGGPYDPNDVDTDLEYWEAYTQVFYVRKYSAAGDGVPTLCVQRLEGDDMTERCLVEGIEELHIEFGIDTDADGVANQYKVAPTAADISNAVVARVYLLVRSISELPDIQNQDSKTYKLGQRDIDAKNDGYLRRVFSTTVQIRNATLPVS